MGGSELLSTDRRARELYEWLSRKAKDLPLEDMTEAWNDRKPRVLTDLLASSTGAVILANEAIVVIAQSNEESSL